MPTAYPRIHMPLHSDHSLRVVVDAASALQGTATSVPLEQRANADQASISLEAYAPGTTWSHEGGFLLELLVVSGQLEIGEQKLPPSSFVRLAPDVSVTFKSAEGCVLYVNRRLATEAEVESFALAGDQLDWRQGMVPGLKVTSLHQGLTKHTALVRWAPETRFNPHTHVGGEEILVLEGVFRDEHGAYPTGTWIRSPHMSNHRPFTGPEGATILVKVGHLDVPA